MAGCTYTTPPPLPSPTRRGGGNYIAGDRKAYTSFCPHNFRSAGYTRRTSQLSPPPSWGRVRVGGTRSWFQKQPVAYARPRPMLRYGFGRDYGISNSMGAGFAASTRWGVTWWISSASPKNSSLKLMADSMPFLLPTKTHEPCSWKKKDFELSVSGTMTYWQIPMACLKPFGKRWETNHKALPVYHPPTLALPHEGGGDSRKTPSCHGVR